MVRRASSRVQRLAPKRAVKQPSRSRTTGPGVALARALEADVEALRRGVHQLEVRSRGMVVRLDESLEAVRLGDRDKVAQAFVDSGIADMAAACIDRAGESSREAGDLASATLAWAEQLFELQPMGTVGEALPNAVPVQMLDRFQLPMDWLPPASGVLRLRILAPEWRLRGKTLRKAMVEVIQPDTDTSRDEKS